jgi:hypothetical protein
MYADHGFDIITALGPGNVGTTNEIIVAQAIAYIEEDSWAWKLLMHGQPQDYLLPALNYLYEESQRAVYRLTGMDYTSQNGGLVVRLICYSWRGGGVGMGRQCVV